MGVAPLGLFVPTKHRIDRLGELGTALLVDTTGVDPAPFEAGILRQGTETPDLRKVGAALILGVLEVLERDFFRVPSTRQDCIFWDIDIEELFELERFGMK